MKGMCPGLFAIYDAGCSPLDEQIHPLEDWDIYFTRELGKDGQTYGFRQMAIRPSVIHVMLL
jgi:hypothetical protein